MALTSIAVTTSLATTAVVALSGPVKIRADGLGVAPYADKESRFVDIYEETNVAGEYAAVPVPSEIDRTGRARLTTSIPSCNFEGYGNYKFVPSHGDITVGYAQ